MEKISIFDLKDAAKKCEIKKYIKKNYVPIAEKQQIIDSIISTLYDFNNIDTFESNNTFLNDIFITTELARAYTNLSFEPHERLEVFDILEEHNISNKLFSSMDFDYNSFRFYFDKRLSELREHAYKTISSKITVVSKLDELIEAITTKVNELDLSSIKELVGGFDINSILSAYMKSDTHKDNLSSVIESKNDKINELKEQVNNITARNVVNH